MEQVAMLAEESKGKCSLFDAFKTAHTGGGGGVNISTDS